MKRYAYALAAAVCLALLQGAREASANGIFVANGSDSEAPVPLPGVRPTDHRVTAAVRDRVADVTVEQVFHSDAARDLEGTYLFPLPSSAAVKSFAMSMGGKMVEGEILEAREARGIYEGIVRRRQDPGLLEKAKDGLFRARVFPIPAHGDVTIRLSFQEVLAEDAGTLEFRYPLATDRLGGEAVDRVKVEVDVESPVALKAIYSPSHRVETVREGERKARVVYEAAGKRETRDFLLYLGRDEGDVGFSVLSSKPEGEDGTFLLVCAPRAAPADAKRVRKDVVFVLDTSGSMEGEKIRQARTALAYGVRTLKEGDRFDVLAFATSVRPWKAALVEATPQSTEEAAAWIGGLEASGGTDIDGALSTALALLSPDRLSFVAFVTDGRPTVGETDPQALVARATTQNPAHARVFTFGVGYDLDVALLDRIAESTKGSRAYVQPGEDVEVATSRFFKKVAEPVLADVTVEFSGSVYDVYPAKIGDLFADEQVTVFGRYREAGNLSLKVRGRAGAGPVEIACASTLRADLGPEFLPRLWANRKVAYLLDEIRLHGRSRELVDEVVRLATRHRIVTPYTSELVVQDGEFPRRGVGALPLPEETEQVHATDVVAKEPTIKDAELHDHAETDTDAPFEGRVNNGLIGIGGGAGGTFQRRGGHRNLRAGGGGGKKSDDAVEHALRWLAAHRREDGSWSASDAPKGAASDDVSATALSVLAFLGAGYTNRSEGPFGRVVGDGLRYLKNAQEADGRFARTYGTDPVRHDALATLALVEAYGMTGSAIYRSPAAAALRGLLSTRDLWLPHGPGADAPSVAETAAWALLALRTSRYVDAEDEKAGRPPVFALPNETFDLARRWLAATPPPAAGKDPLTLSARLAASFCVRTGPDVAPEAQAALQDLLDHGPAGPDAADDLPWSAAALATQAFFAAGGDVWNRWDKGMRRWIDAQRMDGDDLTTKGSFDPRGPAAGWTGAVESTALGAFVFEAYYRYDALRFRAPPPAQGPVPAAAPASPDAPKTDADKVRESEDLRRRREAAGEGDLPGTGK